jgi:hypothetical protein
MYIDFNTLLILDNNLSYVMRLDQWIDFFLIYDMWLNVWPKWDMMKNCDVDDEKEYGLSCPIIH